MTVEQRTQVMDAINLQKILDAQVERTGAVDIKMACDLNDLLDAFTLDQEDLFVYKLTK